MKKYICCFMRVTHALNNIYKLISFLNYIFAVFLLNLLSDQDFMIVIHITFYLRCMVSEITMFYCQPDMTSSSVLRQGALHAIFHDGFWKSDHDLPIAFHSKLLSGMHGFRDNEVLLQAEYDVIMISPPGSAPRDFSWRILKERPWFPDSVP